ncbi:MAG: hypothetical protein ACRES2_06115, partial [Steroidobacteraceae bacterium]
KHMFQICQKVSVGRARFVMQPPLSPTADPNVIGTAQADRPAARPAEHYYEIDLRGPHDGE